MSEEAKHQGTADELARLRADAARLDALDRANAALNSQYGTTYRWRCDANHNRVALTDMEADACKLAALLRRMIAAFNRLDVGQALMALPPDVHGECCAAMREALGALEDDI